MDPGTLARLGSDVASGLRLYSELGSMNLNRELRAGRAIGPPPEILRTLDDAEAWRLHRADRGVRAAYAAVPAFDAPVKVYRGTARAPEAMGAFVKEAQEATRRGGSVAFRGHQSTSFLPSVAAAFAWNRDPGERGYVLEIRTRRCVPMTGVGNHLKEAECVIPDGVRYRYAGHEKAVPFEFKNPYTERPMRRAFTVVKLETVD